MTPNEATTNLFRASAAGRSTYLGLSCEKCDSEVRITQNSECYSCKIRKRVRRRISPQNKSRSQAMKKYWAAAREERIARQRVRLAEKKTSVVPQEKKVYHIDTPQSLFKAKVESAMRGVCYGEENSYPDEPPFNYTMRPPIGQGPRRYGDKTVW